MNWNAESGIYYTYVIVKIYWETAAGCGKAGFYETDIVLSLGDLGKYPTIGELTDFVMENEED